MKYEDLKPGAKVGACIYCGQIKVLEMEIPEDEDRNIQASRECNCALAQEKRAGKLTLSRAEAQITQITEGYDYSIAELLKFGARLIQEGQIDKINVVAENGDKISVATAAKGIKVSKIKTKKVEVTV